MHGVLHFPLTKPRHLLAVAGAVLAFGLSPSAANAQIYQRLANTTTTTINSTAIPSGEPAQFTSVAALQKLVSTFESTLRAKGAVTFSNSTQKDVAPLLAQIQALAGGAPETVSWLQFHATQKTNCLQDFSSSTPNLCKYGKIDGAKKVVLFGDSHMYMYLPVFVELANENNWEIDTYMHAGCGAAQTDMHTLADPNQASSCRQWRAGVFSQLQTMKPNAIVFTTNVAALQVANPGADEQALLPTLIQDVAGGIKANVVSLVDPLKFNFGSKQTPVVAATCLLQNETPPMTFFDSVYSATKMRSRSHACYTMYLNSGNTDGSKANPGNDVVLLKRNMVKQQDVAAGVTVIDPRPWICDTTTAAGMCPPVLDGTLIYKNEDHLSWNFVSRLVTLFRAALPKF